jgi:hypothetical protein
MLQLNAEASRLIFQRRQSSGLCTTMPPGVLARLLRSVIRRCRLLSDNSSTNRLQSPERLSRRQRRNSPISLAAFLSNQHQAFPVRLCGSTLNQFSVRYRSSGALLVCLFPAPSHASITTPDSIRFTSDLGSEISTPNSAKSSR